MGGVFFYIFLSWLTLSISCSVCFAWHSVSLILSVAVKIDQWKMLRILVEYPFRSLVRTQTRAQAIHSHLLLIHSNLTHSIILAFIFILISVYFNIANVSTEILHLHFLFIYFVRSAVLLPPGTTVSNAYTLNVRFFLSSSLLSAETR